MKRYECKNVQHFFTSINLAMYLLLFQESFYSLALKSLISVSTVILLGLILAYHALEVEVSCMSINTLFLNCQDLLSVHIVKWE